MRIINLAKVVIRRKSDGKYLILRSSKWEERPDRSQKPDLAGGIVEQDETIEEGAVREVHEEAGLVIAPSSLQLVYTGSFQSSKDDAGINRLIYFTELNENPKITLSWEHEGFWWMTAEEVRALEVRDPYPEIFDYLSKIGILV